MVLDRVKEGELLMPPKMTRRRFARLSAAAGASVWVRPVFGETHEAAEWVNPLIGASTSQKLGEGKTFPGPTTPFGLVQLSPDTITGSDNAPGYSYEHTTIEGFSFTHMSGVAWYGDFANLMTMATTGSPRFAAGRPLYPDDLVIAVASGETRTKAELKSQEDFIPWKRGVSL